MRFSQSGFTLIEMLVSLAVFAMVVTMSVGTLIVLIGANEQLQDQQTTISNLSFALDSMTRDIRTGTDYHCDDSTFAGQESAVVVDGPQDCKNGASGISFIESGGSLTGPAFDRLAFYFNGDTLYRRIGDDPEEQILSSDIKIHTGVFMVTGSERLSENDTDIEQPTVTIYMKASDPSVDDCDASPSACVHIQTTVTQRILDL